MHLDKSRHGNYFKIIRLYLLSRFSPEKNIPILALPCFPGGQQEAGPERQKPVDAEVLGRKYHRALSAIYDPDLP